MLHLRSHDGAQRLREGPGHQGMMEPREFNTRARTPPTRHSNGRTEANPKLA